MSSLYDAIGGAPAVREAVDRFYVRLLDDPQLAGYFADTDLPQLKRHQVLLFTQLLGGPEGYTGRDLGKAHADLAITEADYDRVGAHLMEVLRELEAPPAALSAIGEALSGVRGDIVTTGATGSTV